MKINLKTLSIILFTSLITLIGNQILIEVFGWSIVDPILEKFMPSKVAICPYAYPQLHDDEEWIRVNIHNEGLSTVNPIEVEYKLCEGSEFKKAVLHSNILKPDDSDFFEILSDVDMSCQTSMNGTRVEYYEDAEGKCYSRFIGMSGKMCGTCNLEVNVYEDSKLLKTIVYPYPYIDANVTVIGNLIDECSPYKDGENKSLVLVAHKDLNVKVFSPATACLRGEKDRDWCKEQGYEIPSCI